MLPHFKSFVFFCNLVDILHAGPAAAATKIKIEIRRFLQLGKPNSLTALEKLLSSPVSAYLSGEWERYKGGLFGNKEYETCRAENSPWLPIQTRGELGLSNKGRAANNTSVIASSDVLSFVFYSNKLHAPRAAGQGPHPQEPQGGGLRLLLQVRIGCVASFPVPCHRSFKFRESKS